MTTPATPGAPATNRRQGDETVNIAGQLTAMAARTPDKPAVVWTAGRDTSGRARYDHVTFRELEQETDRYAHGLEAAGITRGTRTILFVPPGRDFFALVFALFKIGAVPVMVDPGIGRPQMRRCLSEVQGEAFIGVPLAHLFRTLYPGSFRSVRVAVTVGRRWGWGGLRLEDVRADPWQPYHPAPTRDTDAAAILFTSGSTGPAKGVLYEHGMFDAQVRYLRSHFGYSATEIDLPTFPLFALFDAALGMTAVIPDMDFTRPGSGAAHDHRADPRPRRHAHVRVAGAAGPGEPLRGGPRHHAAVPQARHIGRRPGPTGRSRADAHAARARRGSTHAIRRDRGAAGGVGREPRDSR